MSDQVGGMRRCKSWKTDYCLPGRSWHLPPTAIRAQPGTSAGPCPGTRLSCTRCLVLLQEFSYKSTTAVYCDGGCTRCTWGLVLAKEYCCGVLEVILIVLQSCPRMSWCFGPVLLYFVLYAARYLYVYI